VRFRASVESRGSGHVVALPFNARDAFGRVRAPVRVTVRGHTFRTTTMRYGEIDYVGLNRETRDAAGVSAGNEVSIDIELDLEQREVDIPPELASALGHDAAARQAFDGLSYTHRKEYARWIIEAKREDTRARRLAQAVEMLRTGVRTPG
jgi:hypothetical protein